MPNESELPENIVSHRSISRSWNGVNVDMHEHTCAGRLLFKIDSREESTRLSANLDEVGQGRGEPRSAPHTPNPHPYKPRPMYFAPAKMDLWGFSADTRFIKCATVSFNSALLQERLRVSQSRGQLDVPRLRINDDRLWTLVRLLSDAIEDSDPSSQLYGDSLIAAIGARLLEQPKETKGSTQKLSATQMKDALSYLEAHMPARVDLADLADLAGLSQSHYSRAFKASTGLAPYQWQLHARIARAKDLLLTTNSCLSDVAEATGFADAVHFGRTFRKMSGATPAAWRMDRFA